MVYVARLGSRPSTIVFKYAAQWFKTARILRREKPDVVFVMTPPVFAALPAFWYAWRHRKRVVLDAHTAAFLHPRWRRLQWLQRALCRRSVTTLVHTDHIAEIVRDAGGHVTLVPDVPIMFPEREPFARPSGFVVAVVCSFNYDEPLPAILDAARRTPNVHFFVTGNPKYLPAMLAVDLPSNVTLTGFLSTPAYGGLLSSADVVLTLTTRDHTMLRGAYEAIYQGTPVIISDWPLLRAAFPEGAAHVGNTADEIATAIQKVASHLESYRAGARQLRDWKWHQWRATREAITARIGGTRPVAVGDAREAS
jgi:glycosyltransferase involved in cell wall biosynthesis